VELKEKCIIFRREVYYICIINMGIKIKESPYIKAFFFLFEVPGGFEPTIYKTSLSI